MFKKRKISSRSELLQKSKECVAKSKEAKAKAISLKSEYETLKLALQPEIDSLKCQADSLASQFRSLFESSQEAYNKGDGASAKALSIEGKEIQNQCKALNTEVGAKCEKLKEFCNSVDYHYKKVNELNAQASKYKEEAGEFRGTKIKGLDVINYITSEEVESFLDTFPQEIFKQVKEIEYNKHIRDEKGETSWDNKNIATIKIGEQAGNTPTDRQKSFKRVVSHELGHVIYRDILKDEDKADWYVWHEEAWKRENFISKYALLNDEEDFAECFSYFILKPMKLLEYDINRYNKLSEILSKI